jgi:AcrR family transcriptional regulator
MITASPTAQREEILDAALALADERRLEAVSTRAVAEQVGVTPMALYPHVGGNTGLLDAMVGRLLADVPAAGDPQRGYLRDFAHAARSSSSSTPGRRPCCSRRADLGPGGRRGPDLPCSSAHGSAATARLDRVVVATSAATPLPKPAADSRRGACKGSRGGELPGHTRLRPRLEHKVDWDAAFDAELDDLERVIQAAVTR